MFIFSAGWVACGISIVNIPDSSLQQLYITRMEKGQDPVVLRATAINNAMVRRIKNLQVYISMTLLIIVFAVTLHGPLWSLYYIYRIFGKSLMIY